MNDESLDDVELGVSLGAGSAGEVFEVVGRERERVVKRFNSLSIDRDFQRRNFSRLASLSDAHGIPRVVAHRFDRPPYMVMTERAEGRPLSRFGGMKEAAAWKVIRQLAEILGHAHKHGVYHGHLHPGNVLLAGESAEGVPIVLDFGAGLVGEVHHIDLGENAAWCAPEQLLSAGRPWGEGRLQKWDVFSFGLIAYWLINDRLPRGLGYLKERQHQITRSGGRPVPFDFQAFVDDLHHTPAVVWGASFSLSKEARLYREIIDRCLALNPSERPVDLREVRNQFRSLEARFALEDAEERVVKERLKQKAKLFGARTVAACLGISFLGATYYLVEYFRRTYFFQNKVSELDQVVVTQRAQIHHLDERWADTVTDLKQSRAAADSFFHRMAGGESAGGGDKSLPKEELEKSRAYYEKTLADVGDSAETALERARALHSLAHIERNLGLKEKAVRHFREAIVAFERTIAGAGDEADTLRDIHLRLADSGESLSTLMTNPLGPEALEVLESSVKHFEEVIRLKPDDVSSVTRLAGTAFKLGSAYDAHRRHEEAIAAYAKSAELADGLRERGRAAGADIAHLTELVGKLQFQTAKSLRLAGRHDEAINAHVAAMETLELLRSVNGFSPVQSVQLAEGYLELGELFTDKAATPEDLDQLFNESLRLVTPLNTASPEDVEVAVLLCRSLVHLGELERNEAKWSSGYRMTVRGIEALGKALEANPDHVGGHLSLAEARLEHLEFLDGDVKDSVKLALKGVEAAEKADLILGPGSSVPEPMRTRHRERLAAVFKVYGDICTELGETEVAERCRERSVIQVTSVDQAPQE